MKVVLVFSQITYVPGNCYPLLQEVLKRQSTKIAGVVLLRNLTPDIFLSVIWLYTLGCTRMAGMLLFNLINLFADERGKLVSAYGIPVLQPKSMNDPWVIDWVKNNQIDCIINVRTRCIFKKEILNAPKFGCFNIHHGILPIYRGMYCDLYALFERRPAGISFHKMNLKIDDGNIIYTREISNSDDINYINYLGRIYKYEAELIHRFINFFLKHHLSPRGRIQTAHHIVYTRTPKQQIIKRMQHSGLQL